MENRKNCDLNLRGSPPLFWAKSKADVIRELIHSKSNLVECIPLDKTGDYSHTPSDYHLVNCFDESCPCGKYVMCWNCEETKFPLPNEGVEIECNGYEETLSNGNDENPSSKCECEHPDFRGEDKAETCMNAIDTFNDSDYCFVLVELDIENATECHTSASDSQKMSKLAKGS